MLARKARDFAAEQWWRFLLGLQMLTLVNFVLLVITASDKLKIVIPIDYTSELVLLLVPVALVGAWFVGMILERYVKFPQAQERAAKKRSPTWNENFSKLDEISAKLDKLEKKLGKTKTKKK